MKLDKTCPKCNHRMSEEDPPFEDKHRGNEKYDFKRGANALKVATKYLKDNKDCYHVTTLECCKCGEAVVVEE